MASLTNKIIEEVFQSKDQVLVLPSLFTVRPKYFCHLNFKGCPAAVGLKAGP